MARIPDGVIERLKAEVSVRRLAEARGVVLTKHGADLHARNREVSPWVVLVEEPLHVAAHGALDLWPTERAAPPASAAVRGAPPKSKRSPHPRFV